MKIHTPLIISLLLALPCLAMQKRQTPEEKLILAIDKGNLPLLQSLIAHGADIHSNNEEPLRRAARHGDVAMVETLMEAGANSAVNNYEELITAHSQGHAPLLVALTGMPPYEREQSLIVSRKAQSKLDAFTKTFDPQETSLERALLCACIDNNLVSAQALIAKKANVKARDNLALKIASQNNYPEMIALLLKNGATLDGLTAEEFAERYAPRKKQGPFMSPLKKDSSDIDLEKKEALLHVMQEGLEVSKS